MKKFKFDGGGSYKNIGPSIKRGNMVIQGSAFATNTPGYNPNIDPNQPQTEEEQLAKLDSEGKRTIKPSEKGRALNEFLQKARKAYLEGNTEGFDFKVYDMKDFGNVAVKYKGKYYNVAKQMPFEKDTPEDLEDPKKEPFEGFTGQVIIFDGVDYQHVYVKNGIIIRRYALTPDLKALKRDVGDLRVINKSQLVNGKVPKEFTMRGSKFKEDTNTGIDTKKQNIENLKHGGIKKYNKTTLQTIKKGLYKVGGKIKTKNIVSEIKKVK